LRMAASLQQGRPLAGYIIPSRAYRGRSVSPIFYGDGTIVIHAFTWHDLPLLLRYRQRVLCLNYALELTRGNPLGLSMALSHLDLNAGVSTGVAKSENGKSPLAGQVIYNMGDRSAQMIFLLPDNSADLSEHGIMVDYYKKSRRDGCTEPACRYYRDTSRL